MVVGWQRPQGGPVQFFKARGAAPLEFPKRPVIEPLQQFGDGLIERRQTEESALAERRQYPAFHDQHAAFDFGFVSRFADTRRNDGHAVVGGHLLIGGI